MRIIWHNCINYFDLVLQPKFQSKNSNYHYLEIQTIKILRILTNRFEPDNKHLDHINNHIWTFITNLLTNTLESIKHIWTYHQIYLNSLLSLSLSLSQTYLLNISGYFNKHIWISFYLSIKHIWTHQHLLTLSPLSIIISLDLKTY